MDCFLVSIFALTVLDRGTPNDPLHNNAWGFNVKHKLHDEPGIGVLILMPNMVCSIEDFT